MSETHAPESFWEFWQRTMRTKQLLRQLAAVQERLREPRPAPSLQQRVKNLAALLGGLPRPGPKRKPRKGDLKK